MSEQDESKYLELLYKHLSEINESLIKLEVEFNHLVRQVETNRSLIRQLETSHIPRSWFSRGWKVFTGLLAVAATTAGIVWGFFT
jgi:hypothetical protein